MIRRRAGTKYAPRWPSSQISALVKDIYDQLMRSRFRLCTTYASERKRTKAFKVFFICYMRDCLTDCYIQIFSPLHLFSFLYLPMHTCPSLTLMFIIKAQLLLDSAGSNKLVRRGAVEEEIKERLTHITRLSYFLVDFMLAYFSFAN